MTFDALRRQLTRSCAKGENLSLMEAPLSEPYASEGFVDAAPQTLTASRTPREGRRDAQLLGFPREVGRREGASGAQGRACEVGGRNSDGGETAMIPASRRDAIRGLASLVVAGRAAGPASYTLSTFRAEVTPPLGHPLMGGGIAPTAEVLDPLPLASRSAEGRVGARRSLNHLVSAASAASTLASSSRRSASVANVSPPLR